MSAFDSFAASMYPELSSTKPAAQPAALAPARPSPPAPTVDQPPQAQQAPHAATYAEALYPSEPQQAEAEAPEQVETKPPAEVQAATFDPAHHETAVVEPVAKELGLTNEQVAKLQTLRQTLTDRQSEAWAAESNKTFANAPDDVRDAQQAIRDFGSPALKKLLNDTGLGNHPELVRFARNALRFNPFRRY